MKTLATSLISALMSLAFVPALVAQGTAFTYQGRFNDGTTPANGTYDLRFALFTADPGGVQVGPAQTNSATAIVGGLFTVALDFGANIFTNTDRFLEIAARTNGGGAFTNLTPRQKLTPTPTAIFAENLGSGGLAAGAYANAVTFNNSANSFAGSGAGLTSVNAATLGGLNANQFWKTTGNSGTTLPANFLGTTDNQPLELRVNGMRGFRLQPTAGFGASVVGGSNTVDAAAPAATIAGGKDNVIQAGGFYSTIGGGLGNIVELSAQQVVIAGGIQNRMQVGANSCAIGGGWQNLIQSNVGIAVIAGGWTNVIGPSGTASAIGGGYQNLVQSSDYSVISGGRFNGIFATNQYATISGGGFNSIAGFSDQSVIGGGFGNLIDIASGDSVIGGGSFHQIRSAYSFVGGGYNNTIESNAMDSAIAGGTSNTIETNANSSTIAGGTLNRIELGANFSAIGGGSSNKGDTNSVYATIAGGAVNQIQHDSDHAAIGGGQLNTISPNAGRSVIAGGDGNIAGGVSSAIGGGTLNVVDAGSTYATIMGGGGNHVAANSFSASIAGGYSNNVAGNFSFAAGYLAQANHPGTFAWAGGNTMPYASIFPYSVNLYGSNGVSMDYGVQSVGSPRGARYVYVGPTNPGNTITVWNGARLTDGGIWSNASDKNRKTDFKEVDHRAVLERLLAMPMRQWRYTNEATNIKHLGPVAQDFQAAFGLGDDDKTIGTVDADGVALAAIQGLNQKLEEQIAAQKAAMRSKDNRIANLEHRLAALEKLLGHMTRTDQTAPQESKE